MNKVSKYRFVIISIALFVALSGAGLGYYLEKYASEYNPQTLVPISLFGISILIGVVAVKIFTRKNNVPIEYRDEYATKRNNELSANAFNYSLWLVICLEALAFFLIIKKPDFVSRFDAANGFLIGVALSLFSMILAAFISAFFVSKKYR